MGGRMERRLSRAAELAATRLVSGWLLPAGRIRSGAEKLD